MFSKVKWGVKFLHRLLDVFVDGGHEVVGGVEVAAEFKAGETAVHATSQVLGHDAVFDGLDAHLLNGLGELDQVGVVIKAATVLKTTEIQYVNTKSNYANYFVQLAKSDEKLDSNCPEIANFDKNHLEFAQIDLAHRVQAKIEATGLVEVLLPFWCSR